MKAEKIMENMNFQLNFVNYEKKNFTSYKNYGNILSFKAVVSFLFQVLRRFSTSHQKLKFALDIQ